MNKLSVFTVLLLLTFTAFAEGIHDSRYELQWDSNKNQFSTVVRIHEDQARNLHELDETNITMSIVNNSNGKQLWFLKDSVPECDLDNRLSFVKNSLEAVYLFNNDEPVILFAYKIGCTSDLAPVEVKYIAFYKGEMYSLRGSELLVLSGIASFKYGRLEPRPDDKLKGKPVILNYMLKKWAEVSITNMDNS